MKRWWEKLKLGEYISIYCEEHGNIDPREFGKMCSVNHTTIYTIINIGDEDISRKILDKIG